MKIRRTELADVIAALPDIRPLDQGDLPECNGLVATLGFEERTATLAERLAASGVSGAALCLVRYPTNTIDNSRHEQRFAACSAFKCREEVTYARDTIAAAIQQFADSLAPKSRVWFDISTCASYVFYPVMRALIEHEHTIVIGYSEAAEYYPSKADWQAVAARADAEGDRLFVHAFEDAEFLSEGVEAVFPMPLFAEFNPANNRTVLAAVPNFNPRRMSAIIQRNYELNKSQDVDIEWLIGEPPSSDNKWRAEALLRTHKPLGGIPNDRVHRVSTFDYRGIMERLEALWARRRYDAHLTIGDLGSKMQHVGIFLFLLAHQDVGLWLAEPREFKTARYSSGQGQSWFLNLGSGRELKATVGRYMQFVWPTLGATET